jgi:hypothetical protein
MPMMVDNTSMDQVLLQRLMVYGWQRLVVEQSFG